MSIGKSDNSMQIFAKTLDGKTFSLWVLRTDTISDVKTQIQGNIGVSPDEQKLVFQGNILEDNKAVHHYQIADQSVINVVVRLRGTKMRIFAKTMDFETFEMWVWSTEKIADVKKKIQVKIGLSPDEQMIVFAGRILEDDKTVEHYQIAEKSVINVRALPRSDNSMQIFAKTLDGKKMVLWVWPTDAITDVKKKIHEKAGLSPDDQKLVFLGRILEDDKTVDHYQIEDQLVIHVVVRLRGPMQIYAKTIDGKIVVLDVMKTDTIADVKRKIQDKVGLSSEQQMLEFEGYPLEDDQETMYHYQIKEKSVINVKDYRKFIEAIKTGDMKSINEHFEDNWIEKEDRDGNRPIHWACRHGHAQTVKLLLRKACQVDAKTKDGETCLSLARKNGHDECVKIIEDAQAQPKDEFQIFHLPTFSIVMRKHKIYNLSDVVNKIKKEVPCINRPIVVCHWSDPLRWLAPSQKAFRIEGAGLTYAEYFVEDTSGSTDWQSQMAELRDWDVRVVVNASTSTINLGINRRVDPRKWRQYATVNLNVRNEQSQIGMDTVHILVAKHATGAVIKAAFVDFQRFACCEKLFKTLDRNPAVYRDRIRWLRKWTTTRLELLTFYLSNREKLSNTGSLIATSDKDAAVCRISVVQKALKQMEFIPMPSESHWTKEFVAALVSLDYILILCVTDDELAWAIPNTHCLTVADVENILGPSALGSSGKGRLLLIGANGQLSGDTQIDEIGSVIHYAVVLPHENVKIIEHISSGAYGSVSKCKIENEGTTYAIKEIRIYASESEEDRKSRITEVMVSARVGSHPNVVKYRRFFETNLAFYIVMDYMEKSLYDHITKKPPLEETAIVSYAKQILEGLKHLHDQKVIHRDIKSKNVLIDENGCVKLCDFGICKCQTVDTKIAPRKGGHTQIGTHRYMAPELLGPDRPQEYGQKADVWAFGVLMVEMITGKGFYPGLSDTQVERIIRKDRKVKYEFPSSRYCWELEDFVENCLVYDPNDRPTCTKLLENIIFA